MPLVLAAALITLLLAAATPPERRLVRSEDGRLIPVDPNALEPEKEADSAIATIGIYFWLVLALSLLAIVGSYFMEP